MKTKITNDLPLDYKGKIGERWFEVVQIENYIENCEGCILNTDTDTLCCKALGDCIPINREDNNNVIFKEIPTPTKSPMYRGDKERGGEIIKELEKLGGVNIHNLSGEYTTHVYFNDEYNFIRSLIYKFNKTMLDNTYQLINLPPMIKYQYKKGDLEFTPRVAVRGDSVKYKLVIKFLETIGGKNNSHLKGDSPLNIYFLDDNKIIRLLNYRAHKQEINSKFKIIEIGTLPLNPKFKTGDWVRIKSLNKIAEISDLLSNENDIYKYSCTFYGGGTCFCSESNLEPYVPKKGEFYKQKGFVLGNYVICHPFSCYISSEGYNKGVDINQYHNGVDDDSPCIPATIIEIETLIEMVENKYHKTFNFETNQWENMMEVVEFNLKKYDRVIYRDTNEREWNIGILEEYFHKSLFPITLVGTDYYYYQALPYNEDTKELIGTTDRPKKKYIYKPEEDKLCG